MAAFGAGDTARCDVRDLERPEADERAELDHDIVAIGDSSSTKILDLLVSQPRFVLVLRDSRFETNRRSVYKLAFYF